MLRLVQDLAKFGFCELNYVHAAQIRTEMKCSAIENEDSDRNTIGILIFWNKEI